MSIFQRIFSIDEFMPHGMCYEWNPSVICLHVLSDGIIALAYFSIPLTLLYFIKKRKDLAFDWMFKCFAIFIIACGTTHLMEIVNIWYPIYWISGIIKAFTAIVSILTAILLIRLIPAVLSLPSHEQMRKTNEQLLFEIQQRTLAVETGQLLNQQLRLESGKVAAANKELESFSYSISHDLRAPLRAMLGFAGALREDYSDSLPDQARKYISRIERAAERLDHLIRDLLEYSRVTTGEMKIEPLNLNTFIREILQDYPDLQIHIKNIKIEGDLPTVLCSKSGLTQVITNLVRNALKFVRPGEQPYLSIQGEILDSVGRVKFIDKGIGISPSDQTRIFNLFEQINPAGQYDGTGVGLALVKKNMERMNGSIGVQSTPLEGSCFWIDLPIAEQSGNISP